MGAIRMSIWHLAAFATMIAGATYCGRYLSIIANSGPPTFWPASGIYLAFLFAAPIRDWWKLAVVGLAASVLADVVADRPLMPMIWIVKSATFFAGVFVVRRFVQRSREDFHRSGLAFVTIGGLLTPAISALLSAFVVRHLFQGQSFFEEWWFHFAGTSLGILTLTPFLLTALEWWEKGHRWPTQRPETLALEMSLLFLTAALAHFLFSGMVPDPWRSPFFIYALILGVAFRGKPALTSAANLIMSIVIIWHTVNGRGLASGFATWTDALAVIQLLLAVVILTAMIVTSVVMSRNRSERALRESTGELARANAELAQAKEKADEASRAKSAFLANMSHEIRSPLSAMIGFAELLATDQQQGDEGRQNAEIIRRNGVHLHELINQILDLSKVEAGRLEAQLEPVPIRDLVHDVATLMEVETKEKGVALAVSVTRGTPATIISDRLRLHQILLNVLGNAVKFTAAGKIQIRVDARAAAGRWRVTVDVEDTGIGLTPEEGARLFEVFSQADATVARRYGGTGLGLALSQRLARLLGGDMQLLNSEKGVGSTFRFWIDGGDCQVTVVDVARDGKPGATSKNLQGMRVLLADDSPDNRMLVQRYLHMAGAGVHSVENGRDAVDAALASSFDLVLMDIEMPEMDGIEAVKQLRERGYDGSVVALTGRAMEDEIDEFMRGGFDGHLIKPVDRHTLIRHLSRYVRESSPS